MERQIISLFLWAGIASYCLIASAEDQPKECFFGTPEYNETLCKETCTKEEHSKQPYCANFTEIASTIQPQKEVHHPAVTTPAVTLPPQEVHQDGEISTPKINGTDVMSSGISLQASLMCSLPCLLISVYFN